MSTTATNIAALSPQESNRQLLVQRKFPPQAYEHSNARIVSLSCFSKKREAFVEAVSPSDRALAGTTGHAASARGKFHRLFTRVGALVQLDRIPTQNDNRLKSEGRTTKPK